MAVTKAVFVFLLYPTIGLDGVLRLDLPAGTTSGYHGLIDEDKLVVDVTPKIRALGADLCTFRIVNKHRGETPFEVGEASSHPFLPRKKKQN